MTIESSTATPLPGPGDVVAEDVICIGCGYNLRSLRSDGGCTECGTRVGESVLHHEAVRAGGGVPLRVAGLGWLRALRGACVLLLVSAAWKVSLYVGLVTGLINLFPPVPLIIRVGLFVAPQLLAYGAVWRLGAREPTAPRGARTRLRVAIRVALACALLGLALMIASILLGAQPGPPSAAAHVLHLSASSAATGLAFLYLAGLGRRGGHVWLSRQARLAGWLAPVLLLPLVPALAHFRFGDVHYQMSPAPLLGYVQVAVPATVRLLSPRNWETDLLAWWPLGAYGVWATLLVGSFFWTFHRAVRSRAVPESAYRLAAATGGDADGGRL